MSMLQTWIAALKQPIKYSRKEDWDALDVVTKWLVATRGTVTQLTFFCAVVAGLLAWREGGFAWLPWLVMALGVYMAHSTENLVNDYIDFSRGVDEKNYYRALYGIHPLVHEFWTRKDWLRWAAFSGLTAGACGVFMLFYTSFSPIVIWLFVYGIVMIPFYAYPLKYLGLGEILIFLNWGLILIPGVYTVLMGGVTPSLPYVALTGMTFGLGFGSFNWGKHVDKIELDRAKGVRTLPVRLGEKASRYVNMATLTLPYLIVLYLVFAPKFFSPVLLLVFLAFPRTWALLKLLAKPRPAEPPEGFTTWPRWFSTPQLWNIRFFTFYLMLGILLDNLLRIYLPGFWG